MARPKTRTAKKKTAGGKRKIPPKEDDASDDEERNEQHQLELQAKERSIKAHQDEIQAKDAEIHRLTQLTKTQEARKRCYKLQKMMKPGVTPNAAMGEAISNAVLQHFWRNGKFLADDEDGVEAMGLILPKIEEWDEEYGSESKEKQQQSFEMHWETYGCVFTKKLNQLRTDNANQVRNLFIAKMVNGEPTPDPEQYLKVVTRRGMEEGAPNSAQFMAWYVWHVNFILPKVAGKALWSQSIRHYNTPSAALVPGTEDKAICSGMEAFCVLVVENGYQRWALEAELKRSGVITGKLMLKDVIDLGTKDDPNSGNPDHKKRYPMKYTSGCKGKPMFGSCNADGRARFAYLEDGIRKFRKLTRSKAVEQRGLEIIQREAGIPDRAARRRQAQPADAPVVRRVAFGVETDDEATVGGEDEEALEGFGLEEVSELRDENLGGRDEQEANGGQPDEDKDEDEDEDSEE